MKKFVIVLAVAFAVVSAAPAAMAFSVALPPGCSIPPDHPIWNDLNNAVTSCISGAAWDAAMSAQQHGVALPIFKYPATITDKYGITYACEAFLVHGCVDATKTPEYDTYIRNLGHELVSKGYHAGDFGGRFDGVMAAVR